MKSYYKSKITRRFFRRRARAWSRRRFFFNRELKLYPERAMWKMKKDIQQEIKSRVYLKGTNCLHIFSYLFTLNKCTVVAFPPILYAPSGHLRCTWVKKKKKDPIIFISADIFQLHPHFPCWYFIGAFLVPLATLPWSNK